MAGWSISRSRPASRRKRSVSPPLAGFSVLSATAAPVDRSWASQISPIPPVAASRSIANRPATTSPTRTPRSISAPPASVSVGCTPMLVSRRDTRCVQLGARVSTIALLHPGFRVHLVENEGVVAEDAIALRAFDRKGHVGRPALTVLLEGRARLRLEGEEVWLQPGQVACLPHKSGIEMRQEADPRYV